MAMFLSRLKQVLNLGTKSITANGTYTASSDGYDGYSSVSVNVPSVTPTSITPSNSNPAALTSGSAVTPSANGYAIESYSSVTPSNSSPVTLTSGDIVKLGGNGKAVASVEELTPSDVYFPTIVSGGVYKATASGYAMGSRPTNITPSDSSPVSLTTGTGNYYRVLSAGYAIENSPTSVAPSDSNPPQLASGTIYRPSAAGYFRETAGGGGLTRTAIWNNPSPTSNLSAGNKTVSNFSSYDYIEVVYKLSTSGSTTYSIMMSVSDFYNSGRPISITNTNIDTASKVQIRQIRKASSYTSIYIGAGYELKVNSSGSTDNSLLIPTTINGITV